MAVSTLGQMIPPGRASFTLTVTYKELKRTLVSQVHTEMESK